jgi:hypothetical protein
MLIGSSRRRCSGYDGGISAAREFRAAHRHDRRRAFRSGPGAVDGRYVDGAVFGGVLEAANLGEDADTTAAIVGQVAGAFYGVQGIPAPWLKKLHLRAEITKMAEDLYEIGQSRRAQQTLG